MTTADGHRLGADLAVPSDRPLVGGVVVCHPHPGYGGNRHHPVVDGIFRALPPLGFATLRFDFRRDGGDGAAEQLDVVAALDALEAEAPEVALHLAGYSFGAAIASSCADPRVTSVVAIAPPLTTMTVETPSVPVLILVPEHDQFCGPGSAGPIVESWPDARWRTVAMADHFLAGHVSNVVDATVDWFVGR